jgi:DUF2075 family protein
VAQREFCCDKQVKQKTADTERLLRNAYRELLSRGIKETRLLCLDEETGEHIIKSYGSVPAKAGSRSD